MGVAGSGKSRIGRAIAARCGFPFVEGDDLHPQVNVERMTQGFPLDDIHRKDWLDRIAAVIASAADAPGPVVTCSALKRAYRDRLVAVSNRVVFLHLAGDRDLIQARMLGRRGHFMPPSLLARQFEDLEPPLSDEPSITLDAADSPDALVELACQRLGLTC
jgi:gluconokinase